MKKAYLSLAFVSTFLGGIALAQAPSTPAPAARPAVDPLAVGKVQIANGMTTGTVAEGPLKGAKVSVPAPIGAAGAGEQLGRVMEVPPGQEGWLGAKVKVDATGAGTIKDKPGKEVQPAPAPSKAP